MISLRVVQIVISRHIQEKLRGVKSYIGTKDDVFFFCSEAKINILILKKALFTISHQQEDMMDLPSGLSAFDRNKTDSSIQVDKKSTHTEDIDSLSSVSVDSRSYRDDTIFSDLISIRLCKEHKKELEFICLTDCHLICSHCVMRCGPKNHNFDLLANIKVKAIQKIAELQSRTLNLKDYAELQKEVAKERAYLHSENEGAHKSAKIDSTRIDAYIDLKINVLTSIWEAEKERIRENVEEKVQVLERANIDEEFISLISVKEQEDDYSIDYLFKKYFKYTEKYPKYNNFEYFCLNYQKLVNKLILLKALDQSVLKEVLPFIVFRTNRFDFGLKTECTVNLKRKKKTDGAKSEEDYSVLNIGLSFDFKVHSSDTLTIEQNWNHHFKVWQHYEEKLDAEGLEELDKKWGTLCLALDRLLMGVKKPYMLDCCISLNLRSPIRAVIEMLSYNFWRSDDFVTKVTIKSLGNEKYYSDVLGDFLGNVAPHIRNLKQISLYFERSFYDDDIPDHELESIERDAEGFFGSSLPQNMISLEKFEFFLCITGFNAVSWKQYSDLFNTLETYGVPQLSLTEVAASKPPSRLNITVTSPCKDFVLTFEREFSSSVKPSKLDQIGFLLKISLFLYDTVSLALEALNNNKSLIKYILLEMGLCDSFVLTFHDNTPAFMARKSEDLLYSTNGESYSAENVSYLMYELVRDNSWAIQDLLLVFYDIELLKRFEKRFKSKGMVEYKLFSMFLFYKFSVKRQVCPKENVFRIELDELAMEIKGQGGGKVEEIEKNEFNITLHSINS